MSRLILVLFFALAGCSIFDPPEDSLEGVVETLHTRDMNAAIKAAKPGEPSVPRSNMQ